MSALHHIAALLPVALAGMACGESEDARPAPLVVDEQPTESYLVGVNADQFDCETILPLAHASTLLGGPVKRLFTQMAPPAGVPSPCGYRSTAPERAPMSWTFDLDCREGALKDASQLMVSYADAPNAQPILVGQSGLDHNDSALLFIDDDTPCYGRVLGPGQDTRTAIARAIAQALTPRTAPTGAHLQAR